MAIRSIILNVNDIDASIDFYTRFLDAELITRSETEATLDLVTATLRLVAITQPEISGWVPDDLQTGFRHFGFKVANIDERVAELKGAGVRFQLEPINAEGDVRITFFFDPDGTLVELVEGDLRYHEIFNQAAVDADWGMGVPERARFDHVAETVQDLAATTAHFAAHGYTVMGGIHQPSDDRGFEITYLRGGDSTLEIFTFDRAEKRVPQAQVNAPGFLAMEIEGAAGASATEVGEAAGVRVYADTNGLRFVPADA
ncbi:VOC family protein [Mycetocola tolaasinivorans]|uniref:VOC family protein n=1 Tax=Mycetocola tolaasinivorans TaxID=76635 RepID=A0A3L7AAH9_9MICO|nr:VOC family protein [Mycetocola tolaasinivorans]RLP76810.1 VOC family protein [Mycetocola tolaasinivorans]